MWQGTDHFWNRDFLLILFLQTTVNASTTEDLMGEMDFSEISSFLEDQEEMPVSFEEVVQAILNGDEVPYESLGDYIKDILLSGLAKNQQLILRLLVISLAFSILKNYAKHVSGSYISEIAFFCVTAL